jgi:hypothetical protein
MTDHDPGPCAAVLTLVDLTSPALYVRCLGTAGHAGEHRGVVPVYGTPSPTTLDVVIRWRTNS